MATWVVELLVTVAARLKFLPLCMRASSPKPWPEPRVIYSARYWSIKFWFRRSTFDFTSFCFAKRVESSLTWSLGDSTLLALPFYYLLSFFLLGVTGLLCIWHNSSSNLAFLSQIIWSCLRESDYPLVFSGMQHLVSGDTIGIVGSSGFMIGPIIRFDRASIDSGWVDTSKVLGAAMHTSPFRMM